MRKSEWDGPQVSYIDVLYNMFICMLMLACLVQPPAPKVTAAVSPGSMSIELWWNVPAADIDLWVLAPTGGKPVGYGNKSSGNLALLRDDQGNTVTTNSHAYELIVASGVEAGEYVINANFFSPHDGPTNIDLELAVHSNTRAGVIVELVHVTGKLMAHGQEVTLVRFQLDKDGQLVPGSVNTLPKKLVTP